MIKIWLSAIAHVIADCCGLDHATNCEEEKRGIRCLTDEKSLENLDFAVDLCPMSHILEDLQAKTNKLTEEAGQRKLDFLQVNVEKTDVVMTLNQHHHRQQ
ncbi:unnamed protein product [Heterobilharzia americana]|nr:unnamed protein product [Heterobilharzia americana]